MSVKCIELNYSIKRHVNINILNSYTCNGNVTICFSLFYHFKDLLWTGYESLCDTFHERDAVLVFVDTQVHFRHCKRNI